MYHVYVTSYEELENKLNNLPSNEELFSITSAGSQAIVITKDKSNINKAEDLISTRQRLLEQMNMRIDSGKIN